MTGFEPILNLYLHFLTCGIWAFNLTENYSTKEVRQNCHTSSFYIFKRAYSSDLSSQASAFSALIVKAILLSVGLNLRI